MNIYCLVSFSVIQVVVAELLVKMCTTHCKCILQKVVCYAFRIPLQDKSLTNCDKSPPFNSIKTWMRVQNYVELAMLLNDCHFLGDKGRIFQEVLISSISKKYFRVCAIVLGV